MAALVIVGALGLYLVVSWLAGLIWPRPAVAHGGEADEHDEWCWLGCPHPREAP